MAAKIELTNIQFLQDDNSFHVTEKEIFHKEKNFLDIIKFKISNRGL